MAVITRSNTPRSENPEEAKDSNDSGAAGASYRSSAAVPAVRARPASDPVRSSGSALESSSGMQSAGAPRTWNPKREDGYHHHIEHLLTQAQNLLAANIPMQAVEIGRSILRLEPDHVEANHLMARVLAVMGRRREALDYLQRAVMIRQDSHELWQGLAELLMADQNWSAARHAWDRVVRLSPKQPEPLRQVATCFRQMGDLVRATQSIVKAMGMASAQHPEYLPCVVERAQVMLARVEQNTKDDSQESDGASLNLADFDNPNLPLTSGHITHFLEVQRRTFRDSFELAAIHARMLMGGRQYSQAADILVQQLQNPHLTENDRASLRYHQACIAENLGRFDDAHQYYRRTINRERPALAHVLACAKSMLRFGRYREGWPLHEARTLTGDVRAASPVAGMKRWLGEDIRGQTLLLVAEPALGETIRFLRFIPKLRALDIQVALQVPQSLVGLVTKSGLADRVFSNQEPLPSSFAQEVGWYEMLGSLPLRLGCFDEDSLKSEPYLSSVLAIPSVRVRAQEGLLRVGLVWDTPPPAVPSGLGSGNHFQFSDHRLPFGVMADHLANILPHPLYSLQQGDAARLLEGSKLDEQFFSLANYTTDTESLASVLAQLDIFVTVDGTAAHLAGAMGVPTLLMLPVNSDWGWQRGSQSTVWYPNVRLFRQQNSGSAGWAEVLESVSHYLRQMYRQRFAEYLDRTHQTMHRAVQSHDWETAHAALAVVLRVEPDDTDAICLRGQLALRDGRFQAAADSLLQGLQKAIAEKHTSLIDNAASDASMALVRAQDQKGLIKLMTLLLDAGILHDLAFVRVVDHLTDERVRAQIIRRAGRIDSQSLPVCYALGCLDLQEGRPREALPNLQAAHLARPEDPSVCNDLGLAYRLAGDTEQALRVWDQGANHHPGDLSLALNRGDALLQFGRLDDAVAALQRALLPLPEHGLGDEALHLVEPALMLARMLIDSDSFSKAHDVLGWLQKIVPYNKDVKELGQRLQF